MALKPYLIVAADLVSTGGMDRANLGLADHLLATGHELHVVAHRVEPRLLSHPGLVFHRVPRPLGKQLLSDPLLDRLGRFHAARISRRGGRVIVNGGNCLFGDANWVHYVHAVYQPVVVGSPLKRLKAAVAHRRFLAEERRAIGSARTVIADSRRTARDVIELLGVPAARVRTVYYGIDPALFRPPTPEERAQARAALGVPEDRKVLLFIGALGDRRKGFDTTFSAFERLARRDGWDGELWVVGHGGELDAWRARAKASGLDRWIRFLGFRRDVPTLLSAGDALVSPTRYEAYGLGIHEALCVGLPAIASASAGAAERYPASLAGLLLEDPEDDQELAAKLETWRADVEGWRAKVAPVGAALREQTWDRMGGEIVSALEAS